MTKMIDDDRPPRHRKAGRRKRFFLETRMRPEYWRTHSVFQRTNEWHRYFVGYVTAESRDQAFEALSAKDTLFEYRIPEDKT
jgi:hypothetical protein